MDGFSCWKRQLFFVAFAQDVRQAEFSQGPKKRLVVATFRDTVGYLSQSIKAYLRDDLRRDPYGTLSLLLEKTLKGYANEDPGMKQQKALPIILFLKLLDLIQTYWQQQ